MDGTSVLVPSFSILNLLIEIVFLRFLVFVCWISFESCNFDFWKSNFSFSTYYYAPISFRRYAKISSLSFSFSYWVYMTDCTKEFNIFLLSGPRASIMLIVLISSVRSVCGSSIFTYFWKTGGLFAANGVPYGVCRDIYLNWLLGGDKTGGDIIELDFLFWKAKLPVDSLPSVIWNCSWIDSYILLILNIGVKFLSVIWMPRSRDIALTHKSRSSAVGAWS